MTKKPTLIAGLVGVGLMLILVVGLILPKASAVKSKQAEVETAALQQGTLQTQLEQLQAAAETAPRDRKRLAKLESQIPPTADLPGMIRLLNKTADDSGVDFVTVSPGSPSASGTISVIPMQISITGGFFAVDQYLYLLENLPRVSTVSSVVVAAGPSGLPSLTVSVSANFFTTDTSAGPGSIPGGAPDPLAPTPTPSPTVGG